MKPNVRNLFLAAATCLLTASSLHAATVTLTASNIAGTSSFASATGWSNSAAPSAANDYFVDSGFQMRTVQNGGDASFLGNSLTIGNNTTTGILFLKNSNNAVLTINNLTLNNGEIGNGGNSAGNPTTVTIAGSGVTLAASTTANRINTVTNTRAINISAPISGAGALNIMGGGIVTLSGNNSYTGKTTVSSGTLAVSGTNMVASLANGGMEIGAGATLLLSGTLKIDANTSKINALSSGVLDLSSGTDVLDLNGKFTGLSDGFTYDLVDGNITGNFDSITGYDTTNFLATFNNTNGVLTFNAVPEPGAALLGGLGLLGLLRRRRA